MIVELLIFALAIVVPFPVGYFLARRRPQWSKFKNAALAALPACLPFFGSALWVTLTQDMSCEVEPCENMAPIWAMAVYVVGVITAITGFGVGLMGDIYARSKATKDGEG